MQERGREGERDKSMRVRVGGGCLLLGYRVRCAGALCEGTHPPGPPYQHLTFPTADMHIQFPHQDAQYVQCDLYCSSLIVRWSSPSLFLPQDAIHLPLDRRLSQSCNLAHNWEYSARTLGSSCLVRTLFLPGCKSTDPVILRSSVSPTTAPLISPLRFSKISERSFTRLSCDLFYPTQASLNIPHVS